MLAKPISPRSCDVLNGFVKSSATFVITDDWKLVPDSYSPPPPSSHSIKRRRFHDSIIHRKQNKKQQQQQREFTSFQQLHHHRPLHPRTPHRLRQPKLPQAHGLLPPRSPRLARSHLLGPINIPKISVTVAPSCTLLLYRYRFRKRKGPE
ncbi:hypothetical protein glysoja_047683 [Glycine soja]|uniref:Uncharacterized protein n=1 Tax=Glycine soja TaxID=3848 RepID=A0A0B2PD04_GLYSO|nr:hypothetical protein glysoja_047683 [Glycine soja]